MTRRVAGTDRYRNPDEDLPADFDARRDEHYAARQRIRAAAYARADMRRPLIAGDVWIAAFARPVTQPPMQDARQGYHVSSA